MLCFQLRIEVLFYSLLILSLFFFLSISIHKCMAENSNGYSYTIEYVQQQHQMKNKETNKQETKQNRQHSIMYIYIFSHDKWRLVRLLIDIVHIGKNEMQNPLLDLQ